MSIEHEEQSLTERARFAELLHIVGRHGLNGMAERFGLLSSHSEQTIDAGAPDRVAALLRDLGPVAVKLGQLLATREDLLGAEWVRAFATLQDQVPALPFESLAPSIVTALGGPIEDTFARFDREPIAAASIAQVHAAALHDGTEVVVKIRRPGIAKRVDADLRLLRRVARLAERHSPDLRRFKLDELLRFFAESLSHEMDLSAEAVACEKIGCFLAPLGISTPKFYWDHVGRQMNVQERLDGGALRAVLQGKALDPQGIARRYANAVLRMIIFNGSFHADPHPGNVFVLKGGGLGFIDFGSIGTLSSLRRGELVTLILAIAGGDTRSVTEVLLQWSGNSNVDQRALERDLEALIGQFRGAVLRQLQLVTIFGQVFALLRNYKLALPPDLALMIRTLLIAEGVVRQLDPEFDIASQTAPIARELLREKLTVGELKRGGLRLLGSFGRLAAASPELVAFAERIANLGALPVEIQHPLSPSQQKPNRPGDPNILTAGMLVAGAIIQHDFFLVGTALMVGATILAAWIWTKSRDNGVP